ncbi:hypothetical protein BDR03DRAFT_873930 [Suillus americanus]|nr:hypothetical protein BDR03DRAFT_873930 [Suillus americanus]
MSSVSFLLDDKSPLIHYDLTWAPGTSGDSLADQSVYFRGTFQTSNVTGSVATFSFNGTAFWIYGAKRGNHGTYTVTVDGANFAGNSGQSNANLFQQVLFNQSGLTQGLHTVSITNTATGNLYVDIDMVTWQTEFNGTQLVTEAVDDADPRFQYQEPAWNTNPTSVNLFNNGTGHSTSVSGASVTLTFTVTESVSVFGTVGPGNGLYTVSLDSQQATQYNATAYLTFYEVVLYHADNLGAGQHQLTFVNLPETNGQTLNIDYALLTSSSNSSSSSGSPGSSSGSPPSRALSSGAIAGIVVAVGVAFCASAAAFFFYRRWKSAQAASQDLYRIHTPQHPPENAYMGISSSVETRSDASLVRQHTLSQGTSLSTSRQSYQQADYDSQRSPRTANGLHAPSSGMPTVGEIVESSETQSPFDEVGTRLFLSPL